jgi:hypothetical protein
MVLGSAPNRRAIRMTLKDRWGRPLTRCPYGDDCPAEQELKRLQEMLLEKHRAGQTKPEGLAERVKKGSFHNG